LCLPYFHTQLVSRLCGFYYLLFGSSLKYLSDQETVSFCKIKGMIYSASRHTHQLKNYDSTRMRGIIVFICITRSFMNSISINRWNLPFRISLICSFQQHTPLEVHV